MRTIVAACAVAVLFSAAGCASTRHVPSAAVPKGAEWYVGPQGKAENAGTKDSPWDLASVLAAKQKVEAGDTVLLLDGKYVSPDRKGFGCFKVFLAGKAEQPITVQPAPGAHAIIDPGLWIDKPSAHLIVRDLEITVTEAQTKIPESKEEGSWPDFDKIGMPGGGVTINSGEGSKFINLYIHHCTSGAYGWWVGAPDSEIYGCVIIDNGWKAGDRWHGHGVYAQNQTGIKTLSNNIITTRYGTGQMAAQLYGSDKSFTDHFVVTDNIAYDSGSFLVGGSHPSKDLHVLHNYFHNAGSGLYIGYLGSPYNEDCEVRDNVILNGLLYFHKFKKVDQSGNIAVWGTLPEEKRKAVAGEPESPRPTGAKVVLLPNKYDDTRANLCIFNWDKKPSVDVTFAPFLKPGNAFRLMDPKKLYGEPVFKGKVDADGKASIALDGEFAAFVVFKEAQ